MLCGRGENCVFKERIGVDRVMGMDGEEQGQSA